VTAVPAPVFLTARWVHIVMASYELDPAVLQPLVPRGTELDLWEGRCFVSMVGFQFLDTRVLGVRIPFHGDFEEVNLRFYVKREVAGEARRGVVFIKEIVPRRAVAWTANAFYNERYVTMPMSREDGMHATRSAAPALCGGAAPEPRTLAYNWQHRGAWQRLGVTLTGDGHLPDPSSEEAFITEHYWAYTVQRDGSTHEYQVEHPRWRVWQSTNLELRCDAAALYGAPFTPCFDQTPSSCFVADGSAVVVRRGRAVAEQA
jgi:uncharacterized protein